MAVSVTNVDRFGHMVAPRSMVARIGVRYSDNPLDLQSLVYFANC